MVVGGGSEEQKRDKITLHILKAGFANTAFCVIQSEIRMFYTTLHILQICKYVQRPRRKWSKYLEITKFAGKEE